MRIQRLFPIGLCVAVLNLTAAAAELPRKLVRTTTGGRSMLPTLPVERIPIVYEVVNFSELRKGDIVIYNQAKLGPTTHRIFKRISATEWWAKGDGNRLPDADYVTPLNFVGRVLINEGVINAGSAAPVKTSTDSPGA